MKITLTQPEIEQAVREFVLKGGLSVNGGEMAVEFSMGRGDNGLTAAIDVPYMGVSSLPVSPSVPTGAVTANVAAPIVPRVFVQEAAPATMTNETVAADGLSTNEVITEATPAAKGHSLFGTPATTE